MSKLNDSLAFLSGALGASTDELAAASGNIIEMADNQGFNETITSAAVGIIALLVNRLIDWFFRKRKGKKPFIIIEEK